MVMVCHIFPWQQGLSLVFAEVKASHESGFDFLTGYAPEFLPSDRQIAVKWCFFLKTIWLSLLALVL